MQEATTDTSSNTRSCFRTIYDNSKKRWVVDVAPANGFYGNWNWDESRIRVDVQSVYDAGYAAGISKAQSRDYVFIVQHTHVDSCKKARGYTELPTWTNMEERTGAQREVLYVAIQCNLCGTRFTTDNNGNGMAGKNDIIGRCYEAYNEHLSTCTGTAGYICGKTDGQTWLESDVTKLGAGDSIKGLEFK